MPARPIRPFTTLAMILLAATAARVGAQVPRSGGAENAALAQQYQQVLSERTQLQADNAQLKKQLDAAKQELQATKRTIATSNSDATKAQAELVAAQASDANSKKTLEQMRARMQELIAQFRDTVGKMRGVETERAKLQQQLTQTTAAVDKCADRNVQMFQVNAELLTRLQHRGLFGRLAKAEPFTQIERTRLDNLVLEDRERIEALRVEKAGVMQSGAAPGSSATPH